MRSSAKTHMAHLSASLWEFYFLWSAPARFNVLNLLYTKLSDSQVLFISSAQILLCDIVQQCKMVNQSMCLHYVSYNTTKKETGYLINCVLKISACASYMLIVEQPLIPSPRSSLKHSSYMIISIVDLWAQHLLPLRKALVHSGQAVISSNHQ